MYKCSYFFVELCFAALWVVLVKKWGFRAKMGGGCRCQGCYIWKEHQSLKLRDFIVILVAGWWYGDVVMWWCAVARRGELAPQNTTRKSRGKLIPKSLLELFSTHIFFLIYDSSHFRLGSRSKVLPNISPSYIFFSILIYYLSHLKIFTCCDVIQRTNYRRVPPGSLKAEIVSWL